VCVRERDTMCMYVKGRGRWIERGGVLGRERWGLWIRVSEGRLGRDRGMD